MARSYDLRIIPVELDSEIRPGDSLTEKLLQAFKRQKLSLTKGDILIVKHKIVSKAEGQIVKLDTIKPSTISRVGPPVSRDARVVELAIAQSKRIVRRKRGVLITETKHGLICANSGVDVSNVDGGKNALLLPDDPDASAANIHRRAKETAPAFHSCHNHRQFRPSVARRSD